MKTFKDLNDQNSMVTIEGLTDQIKHLNNSVDDMTFNDQLQEIINVVYCFQSNVQEQRLNFITENASLKQDNVSLLHEIFTLKQEINLLSNQKIATA